MRHHDLFELYFEPELAQFGGYVLNRSLRLRRAAQARSDVVRKMRELSICIIAFQRRLLDLLDFRNELWRVLERWRLWRTWQTQRQQTRRRGKFTR